MRRIECEIRREKDTAVAAQAAGDEQLRLDCQLRINHLSGLYKQVTDASGLTPRRERMTVEGFRQADLSENVEKLLTSHIPNGTIESKEAFVRDRIIPYLKTDTIVPRQDIHRQGTKMYFDRKKELESQNQYGPGYVTISDKEILDLVREFKGKGRMKFSKSERNWNQEEVIVTNDKVVGVVFNYRTGASAETTVFKIHYSKKGIHIVPDYPSKKRGQQQ